MKKFKPLSRLFVICISLMMSLSISAKDQEEDSQLEETSKASIQKTEKQVAEAIEQLEIAKQALVDALSSAKDVRGLEEKIVTKGPVRPFTMYFDVGDKLAVDTALSDPSSSSDTGRRMIGVFLDPPSDEGLVVLSVVQGGPAAESGILDGDIITMVDDVELSERANPTAYFQGYINAVEPGNEVDLTVKRGEDNITLKVDTVDYSTWQKNQIGKLIELGEYGGDADSYEFRLNNIEDWMSLPEQLQFKGKKLNSVSVMEIEKDLGHYFNVEYGVLVLDVIEESPLMPGDILLTIDDKPVRSLSHAKRHVREAENEELEVEVKRKKRNKTLTVPKNSMLLNPMEM